MPKIKIRHKDLIKDIIGHYADNKKMVLFGKPSDAKYSVLAMPNMYRPDCIFVGINEGSMQDIVIMTKASTVARVMWPCKIRQASIGMTEGKYCIWSCPLADPEMVEKTRKILRGILAHRKEEDFWFCFGIISKLLLVLVATFAFVLIAS